MHQTARTVTGIEASVIGAGGYSLPWRSCSPRRFRT